MPVSWFEEKKISSTWVKKNPLTKFLFVETPLNLLYVIISRSSYLSYSWIIQE